MMPMANLVRLSAHKMGLTASWRGVFHNGLARAAVQWEAAHGEMVPVDQLSLHFRRVAGPSGAK